MVEKIPEGGRVRLHFSTLGKLYFRVNGLCLAFK